MLCRGRPALQSLRTIRPIIVVRGYRPSVPAASTDRRPIAVPVDIPVPECSPSPSSNPLDCPTPDGSELLPPPPNPRSIAARRSLLLFSIPIPPKSWPSHLDFASPLIAEASNVLKRTGTSVNAIYDGVGTATFPAPSRKRDPYTPSTNTDADADTPATAPPAECYPARLVYPDGRSFDFPAFNEATLDSPQLRRALMYRPSGSVMGGGAPNELPGESEMPKEVLVCTHGARDCRCADYGSPLVKALREQGVAVREIGHVGGHKWAANALLLPSMDMLSNLRASDAAAVASFNQNRDSKSAMWAHWRGRLGLNDEQQARVWERIQRNFAPASETKLSGERVPLTFRTFEGEIKNVEGRVGDSLLVVAHENDLPAMEGTCGGNAECATCHVYLAPRPTRPPVPGPEEDELDMLDFALDYRDGLSRLGCQVVVSPELAKWCAEGGVIDLPRF
ncbi:hypothetical protein CspHIS471_0103360 [Cutaneotrichosporon sp. HIS471]|nr:hypothetical protein CspHIS471_0103360 [Cutaneotrichosporon sp. HIS471]